MIEFIMQLFEVKLFFIQIWYRISANNTAQYY